MAIDKKTEEQEPLKNPEVRAAEQKHLDEVLEYVKSKYGITPFSSGERKVEGSSFLSASFGDFMVKYTTLSFMGNHLLTHLLWFEGKKLKCNDMVRIDMHKDDWRREIDMVVKEVPKGVEA